MTEYWMIEGMGIETERLVPYINKEKVVRHLLTKEYVSGDLKKELQEMVDANNYDDFDTEDVLNGGVNCYYVDFAELFIDDEDLLTWDNDGDGVSYIYYARKFPWEMKSNEPKTIAAVYQILVSSVQRFTDLSVKEIEDMVDDISAVGRG